MARDDYTTTKLAPQGRAPAVLRSPSPPLTRDGSERDRFKGPYTLACGRCARDSPASRWFTLFRSSGIAVFSFLRSLRQTPEWTRIAPRRDLPRKPDRIAPRLHTQGAGPGAHAHTTLGAEALSSHHTCVLPVRRTLSHSSAHAHAHAVTPSRGAPFQVCRCAARVLSCWPCATFGSWALPKWSVGLWPLAC